MESIGINRSRPNWVYLIYASWDYAKNIGSVFVNDFGVGSGIDAEKREVIKNVVDYQEKNTPVGYVCKDNFISRITYDLYLFDNQDWGVVVKEISNEKFNARVQISKNQYYYLKT